MTPMLRAVIAAKEHEGRTAPNPPVGAVAYDAQGQILGQAAHLGAGHAHAEALLITQLRETGRLAQLHTLVVTLEPCNHTGRTPPCTQAILEARVHSDLKRVIYGEADPNPRVAGGGAATLTTHGLEVTQDSSPETVALIAPFKKRVTQGLPWITLKTALRQSEAGAWTEIPEPGKKTFTRPESIALAHRLRRQSDVIATGSGTWLSDQPLLTVRAVAEHGPDAPPRTLWLFDRRRRVHPTALESAAHIRRMRVVHDTRGDLVTAARRIAEMGALRVLVEAGPTLTQAFLESGLWDEHVVIKSGAESDSIAWHTHLSGMRADVRAQ